MSWIVPDPVSAALIRVRLASPTADPDAELPFRILVIADAANGRQTTPLGLRQPLLLGSGGVAALLAAVAPVINGTAPDRLGCGGDCTFSLPWSTPAGPDRSACIAGISGLAALERRRCDPGAPAVERALLAERIAAQIAAVRELPGLRRLESLWRSLEILAARVGDGVELALLVATRDELEEDLGDAPDPSASGLFRTVYSDEYGQHGGRPWAVLVSDLQCGPQARDATLLRRLAALGSLAHTPVLAGAAPGLLGLAGWSGLAEVDDVPAALAGCAAAWAALRGHDDARHAALVLPPPPLRAPLHAASDRLWGVAAMVLAARFADCHVRCRWTAAAAGSGAEAELALPPPGDFAAMAGAESSPPTACVLTEEQARELAGNGLVPLCASRLRAAVAFPAIPSLHRGGQAEDQLPLVLLADRIAHHLKVLQRERLGGNIDRAGLERGLADWLGRHTADGQLADPALRAVRPLCGATVQVSEVPGRAGWMRAALTIRPHLPGAGADIVLALVGRLDREPR